MSTEDTLPPLECVRHPHPGAERTAYMIWNPTAGSGLRKKHVDLDAVVERFHGHGWSVGVVATRCAGDGTEAAKLALAEGADVVVAVGGDGTINEVVQPLANGQVPLGILPVGTINVLARELSLPTEDILACVDAIATNAPRRIDLGIANGRFFTMMIGLGYDAEAILTLIPALKQWSGPVAYYVSAFQAFMKHKAVRARLTVTEGRKTRRLRRLIYIMVVSNTGLYAGGVLKFTPEASIADGLLDVCLIRSKRWYQAIYHVALTFLGRLKGQPDIEFMHALSVNIATARPFPYHLDGDPAGHTPVEVRIAPLGLRVIGGQAGPAQTQGH